MVEHKFGGPWTRVKLSVLKDYLPAYTRALKKTPFTLWYLDSFAGTGDVSIKKEVAHFFGEEDLVESVLEGSARIALSVEPPFSGYVFCEKHKKRYEALCKLREEFPHRNIQCCRQDANELTLEFCESLKKHPSLRAVIFLDPYGLSVEWSTLEAIRATRKIDFFYLFPISAVVRLLRAVQSNPKSEASLNRIYGATDWRTTLSRKSPGPDLFSQTKETWLTWQEIADEFGDRLRQRVGFPYVSEPLPLLMENSSPLFVLFFGVSNPSEKAVKVARSISSSIFKRAKQK